MLTMKEELRIEREAHMRTQDQLNNKKFRIRAQEHDQKRAEAKIIVME